MLDPGTKHGKRFPRGDAGAGRRAESGLARTTLNREFGYTLSRKLLGGAFAGLGPNARSLGEEGESPIW